MTTTGDSLIPYQEMMERALHNLVRESLDLASTDGLPGNHHYYISFRTLDDGVVMPDHLRAGYPDEMTIVLQHQFWGLETDDTGFSVTLSFGGRSERLTVPFVALTAFVDPTVNFGLQFRQPNEDGGAVEIGNGPRSVPLAEQQDSAAPETPSDEANTDGGDDDGPGSGTVVTLDKFRKK